MITFCVKWTVNEDREIVKKFIEIRVELIKHFTKTTQDFVVALSAVSNYFRQNDCGRSEISVDMKDFSTDLLNENGMLSTDTNTVTVARKLWELLKDSDAVTDLSIADINTNEEAGRLYYARS